MPNKRCRPIATRPRHRTTLALNADLWDRFQPALKEEWEGSFTSFVEYAMECYLRDTCDGCPYEEEEGQQKAGGIGKIAKD
ncbi:MAG: hypothetical protein FJZ95_04710 [Chloroflexi bacterium]|nr:hypothetical protein [Chloroflexota bacterium]